MPYTAPVVGLMVTPPAGATTPDGYTYPEIDTFADTPAVLVITDRLIDLLEANTYFAKTFNAAAWAAIPDADKTIALTEASKWLETLCWKGEKCDPAQAMAWPRKINGTGCCASAVCTALPPAIVQAVAELALALHQNKTAIIGGVSSAGATQLVKRQKLGDLEVEYQAPTAGTVTASRFGPSAPLVLQRFPWLADLLMPCYAEGSYGSSRIIARVRS
jgi:hypothetical protein